MYKFLTTIPDDYAYVSDREYVGDKLTPNTIIEKFKLDTWEARMAPNNKDNNGGVIDKSNYVYRHNLLPSTDPSEIDGKILNPYVSDKHSIIQFKDGVKWFDYFQSEGLLTIESALILDESHLGVTCDTGLEATVQGEDKVNRYFILCLGHNRGVPRMLGFTDIRPVCANTLVASAVSSLRNAGKSFNLDIDPELALSKAKNLINIVERRFNEIEVPAYRHFTQIKTTSEERELFFRKILGMPVEGWDLPEKLLTQYGRLEEIYKSSPGMELFDSNEHTGWRMLQATTFAAKTLGKNDWDKYKSRFGHSWVNQTYSWLELRMDKSVAPVKSKLLTKVDNEPVLA